MFMAGLTHSYCYNTTTTAATSTATAAACTTATDIPVGQQTERGVEVALWGWQQEAGLSLKVGLDSNHLHTSQHDTSSR